MEWKPAPWPAAELSQGASSAAPALVYDPNFRRLTGDGLGNFWCARAEVLAALREGALQDAPALPDALQPDALPSLAGGSREDRVLAEIDHDGFVFAEHPADAALFDCRPSRHPRHHNLLEVVLLEGRVCVRKRFRRARFGVRRWGGRPVPLREWALRSFWISLGLPLYNEAAALLRLRQLPFVPRLRRIDLADRALYFDYLPGESLRHQAARGGAAVYDLDLAAGDGLRHLSGREMERREVDLLDAAGAGDYRREIAAMTREINDCGVAPLDIKLGNFIRGSVTGRLYWIDFEIARIASQPRWSADLLEQREILDQLFELTARGYSF